MFNKRNLAVGEVLFAVIVWGASFVATKAALQEASPITVVWLRFLMGVIILGAAMLLRRQLALPPARDLAYLALLGFIGITFHQWLQSTGLVTAQATTTAWLVSTSPIFMALLGIFFLKEKLSWQQTAGIVMAALGVFLVVSKGDVAGLAASLTRLFALAPGAPGDPGRLTQGDALVLLSAPNWAIFSALSRRGLRRMPATQMMFYVMAFGWLFSSFLFFTGPGFSELGQLKAAGWVGVTFLGVACSGLAYIFWYDGLQVMPVAQTGGFLYLEPFVTVVVAAFVLNEPLLITSLLGGVAILMGVWLVQRTR